MDIQKYIEKFRIILSPLDGKERELLLMRYGIIDGTPRTLEEVGKHFGVTRERIRQIEAKGLEKIRQVVTGIEL